VNCYPETGVDSLSVSWAMLDPVITVLQPVAAFVTAVATGLAQNFFGINDKIGTTDKDNKITNPAIPDTKGG
jgi:uncharacterized membrane protein YraQ (UPF0718 family)